MVSRYVTNGPVKQDGICLLPPPHFRMMPPQRPDGYPVSTPPGTYVPSQQQQNQGGNQGVGLRGGITPTVPPNQASTPPNADLKVQPIQQHMFVQQPQVRPTQGTYFRPNGPPSQGQRMANHNNRQQQQPLFAPAQFVPMPQMYITQNALQYTAGYPTQRPQGFVQTIPAQMYNPHLPTAAAFNHYSGTPSQTPQVPYNYYPSVMQRTGGSLSQVPPMNPNPPPTALPNVPPLVASQQPPPPPHPFQPQPPQQQQQPTSHRPPRRRTNALQIIDPSTGVEIELYEDAGATSAASGSHPPSGDSSARQTPQPAVPPHHTHNKEVQAAFAKQVLQAINKDVEQQQQQQQATRLEDAPSSNSSVADVGVEMGVANHVAEQQAPQQPSFVAVATPPAAVPSAQQQLSKLEHVVQSSKLQAGAKEFVLPSSSTAAKETPIVSANCDSIEVTLPNKLPKDRESPVKAARKSREQPQSPPQQQQQPTREPHREASKEPTPTRDAVSDKDASNVKDEIKPAPEPTSAPVPAPAHPPAQAPPTPAKENQTTAEKKAAQKKDAKTAAADPKVTGGEKPEQPSAPAPLPAAAAQQQPVAATAPSQDVNANAKKQNPHRSAAKQQQQQQQQNASNANNKQQQQQAPPTPVPTPQPAKQAGGGKAHKKNELNQKGANKEGTDMDAFNDNAVVVSGKEKEINSNDVTTAAADPVVVLDNDINANNVPSDTAKEVVAAHTNDVAPIDEDAPAPLNNNNTIPKQQDEADAKATAPPPVAEPAPKPAPKQLPATKFDITSIVTEKPKPIKPFVAAAVAESRDETDRARTASQDRAHAPARNGAGAKNDVGGRLEDKLPYKEGQWSPANQDGLKVYDRDFLLALRNLPASRKVPESIPDSVLADERSGLSDGRSSMGGRSSDFSPFNNYAGGKSSSQRGALPKRNSASKMGQSGGGGGKQKPGMKLSISVRSDVKLHESENAWKPARFSKDPKASPEEKKTAELYSKARGLLNKLTPQKFDTLIVQIKALEIDTWERLMGVIDLCFLKAIDEPNYAVAYAKMCSHLSLIQVPTLNSGPDKPDSVNFRKMMISRCQMEFEKNSIDPTIRKSMLDAIQKCEDPEKRKELQFELEEYERKVRRKSVGNVRFIGELFKQKMLTVSIMMRCLNILLENANEESYECMCKLLTTVGKELETNSVNLDEVFARMKRIAENKNPGQKVSSRIRFMLQDVIELRASKWVPRRQDLNPKTIDQIQKEAETEQLNIQMMNSMPPPSSSRKDDRGQQGQQGGDRRGNRGGGGGGGGRNNATEDGGWMTMNTNRNRTPFTVQSDKLKSRAPTSDEPLGNSSMWGMWGKGSVGSNNKSAASQATNTANMYAALENMDMDKRNLNIRIGKDPYHSKGASLERNYNNKYDGGRGSRSGSQHRSNDNSSSSSQQQQRGSGAPAPDPRPAPAFQMARASPSPAPAPVAAAAAAPAQKMSEEQIERRILNSLDEYVNGNCTIDEYFAEIESIPPSYWHRIVSESYLHVLEKTQQLRLMTGNLFATLLKRDMISLSDYSTGLKEIMSQADDLRIDIPKIWDCLAELLVDLICEEALPLDELRSCSLVIIEQRLADSLLAPLLKLVVNKKGAQFLCRIWKESGCRLEDFVGDKADSFVKDNQLEFLVGGKKDMSFEELQEALTNVLASNSEIDAVNQWISANVDDAVVKENKFLRALATAIFTVSIDSKAKLSLNKLTDCLKLFTVYVDNDHEREMQCLYALQTLINKLEHPQGLLLQICNNLYELGTISEESFVAWEKDEDPSEQAGKGVALKQLTSFFTQLKENDDDSSGSGSED